MSERQVLNDAELRAIVRATRPKDELHRVARELLVKRETLAAISSVISEHKLAELHGKATEGPWRVGDGTWDSFYEKCVLICGAGEERRVLLTANANFPFEHDLAFTAALRNALPALLAALGELKSGEKEEVQRAE